MEQATDKNDLIMQKVAMMEALDQVEYDGYQLMARIAIALFFANEWITFSELKVMMNSRGYEYSENEKNRGIASSVSAAQTKYGQARENAVSDEEKESLEYIRHAIAVSFRNKDGEISYDSDKPDHKIQLKS